MEVDQIGFRSHTRTAKRQHVLLSFCLLSLILENIFAAATSENTCTSPGFNSNTLTCSTCDEMKNFHLSDQLISSCKSCCKDDSNLTESIPKFKSAELLICNWKLGHFPQVKDFISNHAKKFKNLSVSYPRGSPPILKLYEDDEKSSLGSSIGVDKWEVDAILEYLEERLE